MIFIPNYTTCKVSSSQKLLLNVILCYKIYIYFKKDNLLLQVSITVLCLFLIYTILNNANYRLLSNIKLSDIYCYIVAHVLS